MTRSRKVALITGITGQDGAYGLERVCQVFPRSTIYPKRAAETNGVAERFNRTLKKQAICKGNAPK